jgi:hypothetical protein
MVRTFLKVYMELGSYFLFLQEQIKDIIIMRATELKLGKPERHVADAAGGSDLSGKHCDADCRGQEVHARCASRRVPRLAVRVQRTVLARHAAVGRLELPWRAGGARAAVRPAEARVAEAVDQAPALGEGEGVVRTFVAKLCVLLVVGRRLLVRPARADETLVRAVVGEAGVAEAGQLRDRGLRRACVGVADLAGRLSLARLEGVSRARGARLRDEVELRLRVPRDNDDAF